MELKELCKECLLHNRKIHNCPFCDVDFDNIISVRQKFKQMYSKKIKHQTRANTVLRFNKYNTELIRYTDEFSIEGNNSKNVNRSRKWHCIDNTWRKKDVNDKRATLKNLQLCRLKARKRSLDLFLNYGQNNEWQYFITMTFDPRKVHSDKQEDIKRAWKQFRERLQYRFPDIKIMAVIEYHADDCKMHFHGVIGNAELSSVLRRAVNQQLYIKDKYGKVVKNENGEPVMNKYYLNELVTNIGDKVYNFDPKLYNDGFCSIIKLADKNNDLSVYEKIIFYLAKYMNKDKSAVPYCGKSFFHTYNLDKGDKMCLSLDNHEFEYIKSILPNLKEKKSNENFTSYVSGVNIVDIMQKAETVFEPVGREVNVDDIVSNWNDLMNDDYDPIFEEEKIIKEI